MKTKEIKFTSISFNEIGIDGLIYHEYKWYNETDILTHFVDGAEIEKWSYLEAKIQIKKLIGTERKRKPKTAQLEKEKPLVISPNQLKLF